MATSSAVSLEDYRNLRSLGSETPVVSAGAPLLPVGGDGTSGGMEARVAVLEANVVHIKDDIAEIRKDVREMRNDAKVEFRITFGALIAVALGLAALMAKGFHWL